jgi:predicted phage baseplate assembly protein
MNMALPAPNLDDRRFQDLVDDAKRFVQQRCPEWSDHNVSDPGVTLIELFAQMVDQVVYRLNRVPDRNYVHFLDLIGLRRHPPVAATVPVTFWLASIPNERKELPEGIVVSTRRTEVEDAVELTTAAPAVVYPVVLQSVRTGASDDDRTRSVDDELQREGGFPCFAAPPVPGNSLYIGLTDAAPANAVIITMNCTIEGIGVNPELPPLQWEAWVGDGWETCQVDSDTTGGLNRDGEVTLHLPPNHEVSLIAKVRAGWIRARVLDAVENQPVYSASPLVSSISVHSIGVTTMARHASVVAEELLGVSDGSHGQTFALDRHPVVKLPSALLEVSSEGGWMPWTEVSHFADSGPFDHHFVLDAAGGEVMFGPAVREPDGSLKQHGAVPGKGSTIRYSKFGIGGGTAGNINRGAIQVLVSSFPGVDRVENREAGVGGQDGETLEEAKRRGPLMLRSRGRAVTAEDFEELARGAAPDAARVRCVPAGVDGPDAGAVRMLVVPQAASDAGRLPFERLVPPEAMLRAVAEELDRKRLVGTRISVEPPVYQGLTVVARVMVKAGFSKIRVQADAITALHGYFHPISGGPDGGGWPFGRAILLGEVYSVLQRVGGLDIVEDARLFGADPITGERGPSVQRIDLSANALVYSFDHQVLAEER